MCIRDRNEELHLSAARMANSFNLSMLHTEGSVLLDLSGDAATANVDTELDNIFRTVYNLPVHRLDPKTAEVPLGFFGLPNSSKSGSWSAPATVCLVQDAGSLDWHGQMRLVDAIRFRYNGEQDHKCLFVLVTREGELQNLIYELREALLFHVMVHDPAAFQMCSLYSQQHLISKESCAHVYEVQTNRRPFMHKLMSDYLRALIQAARRPPVSRGPGPRVVSQLEELLRWQAAVHWWRAAKSRTQVASSEVWSRFCPRVLDADSNVDEEEDDEEGPFVIQSMVRDLFYDAIRHRMTIECEVPENDFQGFCQRILEGVVANEDEELSLIHISEPTRPY
eukprot:TRINITY_DN40742_c0_g1_i1.p1 TRINITY_DN40742_c0_g1~~TRINITY_DN40742_c0_g1_i1.p1  ORF type:complete len:337 (+),score=55.75 TRINITY_DN40742_c0_g1_i1:176-1186(+)